MVKFPSNPQIGDIFTLNSKTWEFNGVGWVQKTIESDPLFNSFLNTGGTINGNLTINGVITGDGSGLTNIPASGVTGLNLDRITSGSNSAIMSSSGLTINTGVTATSFVKNGGLSSQFLMADGSTTTGQTVDLTSLVPYSGATKNVNLGDYNLNANGLGIGTTGDTSIRLDVNGPTRLNGRVIVTGTTSGSTSGTIGLTQGINISPTLVPTGNTDTSVGVDINPTFVTASGTTGSTKIGLRVQNGGALIKDTVTGSTVLQIQGTTGNLFAITDVQTGTLFQVTDISGIPLLQVDSSGYILQNAGQTIGMTTGTTYTVYSIDKTKGSAAFIDYRVSNPTTNAYRAGTIMCVWNSSSNTIEYTETSTMDLGASTSGITLSMDINVVAGYVRLLANTSTNSWNIKLGVRII